MIVKYCDKCNKKICKNFAANLSQCKLPTYRLSAFYIGCLTSTVTIDLCDSCQSELDNMIEKWMEGKG